MLGSGSRLVRSRFVLLGSRTVRESSRMVRESSRTLIGRLPCYGVEAAICLIACIGLAGGQFVGAESMPTGSTTVARVYVSYTPSGASANKIKGFNAAANGTLSTIAGSPFAADVTFMAVNRSYLFGSKSSGNSVPSFRIKANGALQWVHSTNVQAPDPTGCAYASPITLDRYGSNLYRVQYSGGLCDQTHYQSFWIDKTTGKLHYQGKSADRFLSNSPLSFTESDKFAYGSECMNYEGNPLDTFAGYARQTSGLLDWGAVSAPDPATQDPNDFYCRAWTAADARNHVAVTFTDTNFNDPYSSPPTQLGVYTVQTGGNLTTTSTWANMPSTAVGYTFGLAASRDGKLLAVFGTNGLQVFHFNGASPITAYTGLLTTDEITQAYWDHNHHLYALAPSAHKLYVFTVTGTSVTAAPGSPHALAGAQANMTVESLTDSDGDWDND